MWERFKKAFSFVSRKRYLGFMPGHLPVDAKHWGADEFLKANEISLYVNRAIAKRAEKVGEIEFQLKNKKGEVIKNADPLFNLLYKPNKIFTGRQFWNLYQKFFDLTGEAYILIERNRELFEPQGKVTGLHLLKPDLCEPEFNESTGDLLKVKYKLPEKTIEYPGSSILYIWNPDPKNPLRGQSLLKAGVTAIQTETQIDTYHSRILQNGGKVEGVFKFKTGPLTKVQLKELKEQYKKEYAQAKKAGLPLFLGGDSDYIRTGLTPDELSYLEAKKVTLEDICIMTGVPKAILASMDDIQYSNADTSIRIFLRETIRPLLITLATALDEVVFPDDRTLDFVDPTPENIETKLKELETADKINAITINEKREKLGLDPIAGGDVIMMPFNLMPFDPSGNSAPNGQKDFIKKENTPTHPNTDPEIRSMWGRIQIKRMDAREKKVKDVADQYFREQEKRLIESLSPTKNRVFRKKELLDEILIVGNEVKIGKEMFLPVLEALLIDAGIDAMEFAGSSYKFNLTAEIAGFLDKKTDIFLRSVNETTFGKLKDQFAESYAAGESRDELIKRVENTYGDIRKSRAGTIARTETHNATQYGTLEGYRQAGLATKVWVAVMDGHTRDSHAMVDGEERPLDTPFSNGLMLPGDPNGPAEEVINCRCVI